MGLAKPVSTSTKWSLEPLVPILASLIPKFLPKFRQFLTIKFLPPLSNVAWVRRVWMVELGFVSRWSPKKDWPNEKIWRSRIRTGHARSSLKFFGATNPSLICLEMMRNGGFDVRWVPDSTPNTKCPPSSTVVDLSLYEDISVHLASVPLYVLMDAWMPIFTGRYWRSICFLFSIKKNLLDEHFSRIMASSTDLP